MSLWMVELSGTPTSLMLLKDAENKLMMIVKLQLMSLFALVITFKETIKTLKILTTTISELMRSKNIILIWEIFLLSKKHTQTSLSDTISNHQFLLHLVFLCLILLTILTPGQCKPSVETMEPTQLLKEKVSCLLK